MDKQKVIGILDKALEYEMGAMVKLLHHSFLVYGPGRGPIQALLRQRVKESIGHATAGTLWVHALDVDAHVATTGKREEAEAVGV